MFNQTKKFIPYILILIVVVGFFGFNTNTAKAQDASDPVGKCNIDGGVLTNTKKSVCEARNDECVKDDGTKYPTPSRYGMTAQIRCPQGGDLGVGGIFYANDTPNVPGIEIKPAAQEDKSSALSKFLGKECGIWGTDAWGACILMVVYWIFYGIGSFLLWVTGYFFNAIIAITLLDTSLYSSQTFLTEAWAVVRDFSNIFFILILLYVAIQMILGLGGGHGAGPQKIITQVIIMSLLINFSMFFTKVVIDTSNIIAVVFYNKLAIETKITRTDGSKVDRDYTKATGKLNEKDLSGAMMAAFNPTKLISAEFLEKAKSVPTMGTTVNEDVPFTMLLALIILSGLIMCLGAYAFFIAGASFLGRMVELWVLIIFSPFAFMSSSISVLSGISMIGWGAWFSRLISASFMAPMFMFFMYFIFKLIAVNPFAGMIAARSDDVGIIGTILLVVIPSLVILSLLMKATDYAKKGSGQFGEMALGAVKGIAALTAGGAILTAATVGKQTVGRFMKGASTGDTAAGRLANNQSRGRIDRFVGQMQQKTGFAGFQQKVGKKINDSETRLEHGVHARRELDEAAQSKFHKKWNGLTAPQKDEVKLKIEQDFVGERDFGKKWNQLDATSKSAVTATIAAAGTTQANHLVGDSKTKEKLSDVLLQASRNGTYDVRNLANVIMREQSTGFAKIAMGLTGALAMGMRGGFKSIGINTGKAQGAFFKDLGTIISESLKSVKLNVDLSHVGDEHKGDDHGGGHGGGHH